jgi:hypothetical protein
VGQNTGLSVLLIEIVREYTPGPENRKEDRAFRLCPLDGLQVKGGGVFLCCGLHLPQVCFDVEVERCACVCVA